MQSAPPPKDVSQLKSFIGLVNYYDKFLPGFSSTLAPLYKLLLKAIKWSWGAEQQKSFEEVKKFLISDGLLVHYDPSKELILACDASPYGIGAVLSHRDEMGQEHPITFASRTLGTAEKNYSQPEKEGLAIIFGVKRFHHFLFGRHFIILSDHKPLQRILRKQVLHQWWHQHEYNAGLFYSEDTITPLNTSLESNTLMLTYSVAFHYPNHLRMSRHHRKHGSSWFIPSNCNTDQTMDHKGSTTLQSQELTPPRWTT